MLLALEVLAARLTAVKAETAVIQPLPSTITHIQAAAEKVLVCQVGLVELEQFPEQAALGLGLLPLI